MPLPRSTRKPRTLVEKIWERHVVAALADGHELLHIDRHVLQETTSGRAFAALRRRGLPVPCPDLALGTQDHLVSTAPGWTEDSFPPGRAGIRLFRDNCRAHGIALLDVTDARQGGLGALARGIGTTEVGHAGGCRGSRPGSCTAWASRRCPIRIASSSGW